MEYRILQGIVLALVFKSIVGQISANQRIIIKDTPTFTLTNKIFEGSNVENLLLIKITSCQISKVDENTFQQMHKLLYLSLAFNEIKDLDVNMFQDVEKLQYLNLTSNELRRIEDGIFDNLKDLKQLDLRDNKIVMIEKNVFKNLVLLEALDLSYNHIKYVNSDIFKTNVNLKKLMLTSNKLERIDNRLLANQKGLLLLDFSRNLITDIDKNTFKYLYSVIVMDLEYNFITYLDNSTFENNINLEILKLNDNNLVEIQDGLFTMLANLVKITLNGNEINVIGENVFPISSKLEEINLERNYLKSLKVKTFNNLKSLRSLFLVDNRWYCDCNLMEFHEFYMKNRQMIKGVYFCYQPENVKNREWTRLRPRDFTCNHNYKTSQNTPTNKNTLSHGNDRNKHDFVTRNMMNEKRVIRMPSSTDAHRDKPNVYSAHHRHNMNMLPFMGGMHRNTMQHPYNNPEMSSGQSMNMRPIMPVMMYPNNMMHPMMSMFPNRNNPNARNPSNDRASNTKNSDGLPSDCTCKEDTPNTASSVTLSDQQGKENKNSSALPHTTQQSTPGNDDAKGNNSFTGSSLNTSSEEESKKREITKNTKNTLLMNEMKNTYDDYVIPDLSQVDSNFYDYGNNDRPYSTSCISKFVEERAKFIGEFLIYFSAIRNILQDSIPFKKEAAILVPHVNGFTFTDPYMTQAEWAFVNEYLTAMDMLMQNSYDINNNNNFFNINKYNETAMREINAFVEVLSNTVKKNVGKRDVNNDQYQENDVNMPTMSINNNEVDEKYATVMDIDGHVQVLDSKNPMNHPLFHNVQNLYYYYINAKADKSGNVNIQTKKE